MNGASRLNDNYRIRSSNRLIVTELGCLVCFPLEERVFKVCISR